MHPDFVMCNGYVLCPVLWKWGCSSYVCGMAGMCQWWEIGSVCDRTLAHIFSWETVATIAMNSLNEECTTVQYC